MHKKISLPTIGLLPGWMALPVLLGVCVLSYSLLIGQLGFYWDDYPITWIAVKLGPEALAKYFSTNRPYLGMLFQVTTRFLGSEPWHWHLFAVFWRWVSAAALWWLLRLVWKRDAPAFWASLLFAVYPGAVQQFIAMTFGHFFLILAAFFASLICSVLALRKSGSTWLLGILGLLLSAANLVTLEYFFMLELIRPVILWFALQEENLPWRQRVKHVFWSWLPYLLLFAGFVLWRAFFFNYQTQNYQPQTLTQLRGQPLEGLKTLVSMVFSSLWTAGFAAWGLIFRLPDVLKVGRTMTVIYGLVVLGGTVLTAAFLFWTKKESRDEKRRGWGWGLLLAGAVGMLLGGLPFWLTGIPVTLGFPFNRTTLSFILGVSLFWSGVLAILPLRNGLKIILFSLLAGLSIGCQFQNAVDFRRDWSTQNILFWQMTWRIPALQPGTTIVINQLPVRYYTDNSLTGLLNWTYAPENGAPGGEMPYIMYYPNLRLGTGIPSFEKGIPMQRDYLAATFHGNTSQVVTLFFSPPGCLRVLDPELDTLNIMLPELMRSAASLSTTRQILAGLARPPQEFFKVEPAHRWCYAYLKADLARQQGDWEQVVEIGKTAFDLGDYPNDPSERIPFIEAYAHAGDWEQAIDQTRQASRVSPEVMAPVLCRLWQRIGGSVPASSGKDSAVESIYSELGCKK